jgi:predicted nucleic acid-binding protein
LTLVIDASVACKWFIAEPLSDHAEALLVDPTSRIAPDLIIPEVCNVARTKLRRGEITPEQATVMVAELPELLEELVPCAQIAARALSIACTLDHPSYDCFYMALAEAREARLVTADRKLSSKLAQTRWAGLLIGLGEAS